MSNTLLKDGDVVCLDENEFKVGVVDYGDGTHGYWLSCTDPSAIFNMYRSAEEVEADLLSGKMRIGRKVGSDRACSHEIKRYVGFTRIDDYCVKCGKTWEIQ
jgi:hypothetical protein